MRNIITLFWFLFIFGSCTVIWVSSSKQTSINTRGLDSESSSAVSSEVSNLKDEISNLNKDVKVIDNSVNKVEQKVEQTDSIIDKQFKKK